jgi:putative DNA methylase
MSHFVIPFSLKDAPELIERLLPVQKLSAEAYKEQMAGSAKTLTVLGSYWKGRKPLVLNKACILGCLLPATDDPKRDLEIFEKLMAMDDESFVARWPQRPRPKQILAQLTISRIADYFSVEPAEALPESAPVDWSKPEYDDVRIAWREGLPELERRRLEAQLLPKTSYRDRVEEAKRAEEVMDIVHDHIWDAVNVHLGTNANSFPELVEQLGVMRFGHRPRVGDTFCGSGQIPFEAARLGCDVYASDLNPVACMLTWGAFNIVGGSSESQWELERRQRQLVEKVQAEIDALGVDTDGGGWRSKVFLYCVEARCPETGWMVPLIPSFVISKPRTGEKTNVIAELIPDRKNKRYEIAIRSGVTERDIVRAEKGTVRSDGRGQAPYMVHTVDGREYRTKISTLRGDFRDPNGSTRNKLRLWERSDFKPRPEDIFQERLYAVQWMRPKKKGKGFAYEFRSVTGDDLQREYIVEEYVGKHLADWQAQGWIPNMRIETGDATDGLIRTRGWTHWHHLFNPRQLLVAGLVKQHCDARLTFGLTQLVNWNSRLCPWNVASGGGGSVQNTFYNQVLNTLLNYGCRSFAVCAGLLEVSGTIYPMAPDLRAVIANHPVPELKEHFDVFITDPP